MQNSRFFIEDDDPYFLDKFPERCPRDTARSVPLRDWLKRQVQLAVADVVKENAALIGGTASGKTASSLAYLIDAVIYHLRRGDDDEAKAKAGFAKKILIGER